MSAYLPLLQVATLYFLSRALQRAISGLFLGVTGRRVRISTWLMALLFLPGTAVHELAHLVVAKILLVPAGQLSLHPRADGDRIVMGSVMIGKTDPVRRLLVGIAPILVGIGLMLVILVTAEPFNLWQITYWRIILGYVVFQLANTMFSSRADLRGAGWLFLMGIILAVLAYGIGWRPNLSWVATFINHHRVILDHITTLLWLPLAVNAVGILLLWLLRQTFNRQG